MSTWDKLSMADRAKYIKLAVQNGITSLGDIREAYNKYAEGGPTAVKRNGGKLNSNKYGGGSWIQSIMDGTLWDEWKSAIANKEVVQGQPAPGNPIVSNKNLNKTEGKSSKETFLYNGNTVYRDLDNNYYDAKGNKLADPENDLL